MEYVARVNYEIDSRVRERSRPGRVDSDDCIVDRSIDRRNHDPAIISRRVNKSNFFGSKKIIFRFQTQSLRFSLLKKKNYSRIVLRKVDNDALPREDLYAAVSSPDTFIGLLSSRYRDFIGRRV